MAQPKDADPTKEITVEAPRSFPSTVERSPYSGGSIITTTVRIPVRYDDLDLTNMDDQHRLMTRVFRVAQSACQQLDVLYPLTSDPDCVENATRNSAEAAKAVIAEASATPAPKP